MRIAVLAPIEETVPPQKYGGTEWIVYQVAHGMGMRGHEVDLYASADSKKDPSYNLIPLVNQSLRIDPQFAENIKMRDTEKFMGVDKAIALLQQKKYDLIHNHKGWRFLIFSNLIHNIPIVTTHHGPLSFDYQNLVFNDHKDLSYVSISNNQRKDLPDLNFIATVYNGIDITKYPMVSDETTHKYPNMFFLARMNDEKGAIEAASTAFQTKQKLVVAAKVDEVDKPYFAKFQSYIDNNFVTYVGELDFERKLEYLQTAKCLLAPIKWEEPFGLMFTEAMVVGTPVIAFSRGSAPEIIVDGVTGFLVNESAENARGSWIVKKTGIEGLCEAVQKIYDMPEEKYIKMRMDCRKHVEQNFSVEKMVDGYEEVYKQVLAESHSDSGFAA